MCVIYLVNYPRVICLTQCVYFTFSLCDVKFPCSNGGGDCLEDTPPASVQPADPTLLVGRTFDADAQCQAWLGANAEFCTSNINVL